ncbi:MAG: D-alanyl-D-alanine carboxypeptidase/D-alanyl-D-alanine-endopeptidase [Chrysiogenetes bacterium]|nr:D-alanyl-D-alanine carboxypeptidase/D-alanyl-D-alanine-endopeptidase [Chrysiogenetes bacterium]
MRRILLLSIAALLLGATGGAAQTPAEICPGYYGPLPLQKRLDQAIAASKYLRKARFGMQFASATEGIVLYEKNPATKLIPASVTKVVTGAASLEYLGQEYSFPTDFYGELSEDGTRVTGPLYVKGSGDPSLVSERLYLIAETLAARGIKKVEGGLVIDEGFFDTERFNPDWKVDSDRSYIAATGAVSSNFNAITIVVRPGQKAGDPARVVLEPQVRFVTIENNALTGAAGSRHTLSARRVRDTDERTVQVNGRIATDYTEKRLYLNVASPPLHTGDLLLEFFARMGIEVAGGIGAGTTPEGATLLERSYSKPLGLIVQDMGKYSNNFVAEQMVKTLGATKQLPPGTWRKGIEVLSGFLQGLNVPLSDWELEDGSGLSHGNRLTPRALVRVLAHMFQDPRLRPEFESSLSLGGADGTVRRRFRGVDNAKRVRAKTGHLSGVSALAGYLYPEHSRPIAFSVLVNNFEGGFGGIEGEVDGIVEEVLHACAKPPSLEPVQLEKTD